MSAAASNEAAGKAGPNTVSPKTALIMVGSILAIVAVLYFVIMPAGTPIAGFEVLRTVPRPTDDAYTQGLEFFEDGYLYEGTGGSKEINQHRSLIRRYDWETGKVVEGDGETMTSRKISNDKLFGEGITELDGYVWQLTWRAGIALRYKQEDLLSAARSAKPPKRFQYLGQGWGLTNDGKRLIMSDGSANLALVQPDAETGLFQVIETIQVTDSKGVVPQLNELEYIEGDVYANIYESDLIAVITWTEDQVWKRGQVKRYIDLSSLRPSNVAKSADFALNGIAWRPELQEGAPEGERRLVVTGKQWPAFYLIKVKQED